MGINRDNNLESTASGLRHQAETQLDAAMKMQLPQTLEETQKLLHELQVHQIELKMQNEELREARNEAEAALERFTNRYDFAPVGYVTLDRTGIVRAANVTIAALLGVERSRMVGLNFGQFVTCDDRQRYSRLIGDVCANGSRDCCDVKLVPHKTNIPLFVQIQADSSGDGQECSIAVIDMSAIKRAEKEMSETEELSRKTLQALPAHIAVIDRQGQIIAVNEAWSKFARDNEADGIPSISVGSNYCHVCRGVVTDQDSADTSEALTGIEAVLNGVQEQFSMEYPCHSLHQQRWFLMTVVPLGTDAESGAVISHLDITERKQSEEALRFLAKYDANSSAEGFFKELAVYLARTLNMDFVCIDRLEEGHLSAQTLAVFHNGQFEDNISYALKDTPCGDVVGQEICSFSQNVRGLFPRDELLEDLQAESYLGSTIWSTEGTPIGLIAVIGRQPLENSLWAESLLKMVSLRAAGVLESQLARETLQKSEKRFRDVASVSADWVWEIDGNGVYTYVSGKVKDILGYEPEELLGRTPFDLMSLDEAGRIRKVFQEISDRMESFRDLANVNLHKNGTIRHVLTSGVPVFDKQGNLCGYRGVDRDITERKLTENMLREKDERLDYHLDNSPLAIIEWDHDFIVTRWTGESERMFGWSAAEAVGRSIPDLNLVYEGDFPIAERTLAQLRDGVSQKFVSTNRNNTKSGAILYCTWYNSVLLDTDGRMSSVLSKVIDITPLRLAEMELQKFVSLADQSDEFIGICDLNLVPYYANEAAMRLIGYDGQDDIASIGVLDFFYPEDRDFLEKEFFPKVLREGRGEIEIRFRHMKTGKPIWMLYNVFYIRNIEGHPVGLATVSRNINQIKKAIDQLNLLADTANQLLVSESPQDLVEPIGIKAMAVLDCHTFLNFILDEETGRLHLNACSGLPGEEQSKIEWFDTDSTISECAARNATRNNSTDPGSQMELVRSYDILSYACYPLMSHDRVLGTLSFVSGNNCFSEDDLSFMRALADQFAIALERTRNENALKKSHDMLEQRVAERTTELTDTVTALLAEIDERVKIEKALEKSGRDIEDLYNLAPCGYHSLDKDGIFVRVNETELHWLGYTRDELVGKMGVSDVLTPESLSVFVQNFPQFTKGCELSDMRMQFIRKDGSILPVLLNAVPIIGKNGDYLMSRSTIYDISDLVRAEESAKRQNLLYLCLSETGKAIAHLPDREALFAEICRITVEHGGFLLSWIGMVDELNGDVHVRAAHGATSYLSNIRITANKESYGEGPTGIAISNGTYYICNDFQNDPSTLTWHERGKMHGINASASFALKCGGRVCGTLNLYAAETDFFDQQHIELLQQIVTDVSFALDNFEKEEQRKRMEKFLYDETVQRLRAVEALREKEQLLMQQSRQAAMGEMIGNIAHQWRQPLNALALSTQRLDLFYDTPRFNKEFLNTSVKKSMEIIQYMSRTIDDFRNFFLIEREKSEFSVIESVRRALSLVDSSFNDRSIHVEIDERQDSKIQGYPNEYAQVLLNILLNAKDAIDERTIATPCLKIAIDAVNGISVVTIGDNAGGISGEFIDKVFNPYFTTKGPQQGTGVGLFMAKTIIEKNMGGRLTVCNTDVGAEFRIEV